MCIFCQYTPVGHKVTTLVLIARSKLKGTQQSKQAFVSQTSQREQTLIWSVHHEIWERRWNSRPPDLSLTYTIPSGQQRSQMAPSYY